MGIALKLLQSMRADGIFLHITNDGNLGYEAQRALTSEEIESLKNHKPALMALLKASATPHAINAQPQCSVSQENLYLLCQSASVNASYNLCFSLRFEQRPDLERLKEVLAHIQVQQPALRSGFQREGGEVVLYHSDTSVVPFKQLALDEQDYEAWLAEVSETPFDLSAPPLWRFWWVETAQACRLVVLVHHIVWDGWSSARFRQMLDQAYGQNLGAVKTEENLGADRFAQHQKEAEIQGEWQQSLEYWKDLLACAPKQNDWLRRKQPSSSQACHAEYQLSEASLSAVAPSDRFNMLLSAWFLALGRQYRCNRMVLGVAVANRDLHTDLESSLGYFNNVVPVTQHHLLTTSAKQVLANVKAQWRESIVHQSVPFGHIVNAVMPHRTAHDNPLTQVVIGYQSFDWDSEYVALPHQLEVVKNTQAKLPLSIQMAALNSQLTISVEYDPMWYEGTDIDALIAQFNQAFNELSSAFEPPLTQAWIKGAHLPPADTRPRNLAHMLKNTAQTHPDKPLTFVASDGRRSVLTYEALYQQAVQMAGRLQQGKPWSQAGRPVIVVAADLAQYVVNFWAVILAGGQPATINAPQVATQDGLTKIVDAYTQLNHAVIVCCPSGKQALSGLMLSVKEAQIVVPSECSASPYLEVAIDAGSPGIIQLSSGSTGKSKCIQQSHQTIVDYCDLITQSRGQLACDVSLNWMGFDHVGGLLFTHLRDTYLGCEQVHVSTPFVLQSPLRWLALIEEYQVTHSWCPNFAYKLMTSEAASTTEHYDLSSLKELINGGEMVVADTVRRFIETFTPWGLRPHVLTPAFGMAESCTVISIHPVVSTKAMSLHSYAIDSMDDYTQIGHSEFVSLGHAVANTEIRIVNDNNEVLNEYEVGKMQLRGPSITMGYLAATELNDKAFVGDGWFDTGDCGVIVGGELYLTGRLQEKIVLNGMNFFNHDIEAVVGSVEGVDETCVAAAGYQDQGDAAVVFYVAASSAPQLDIDDRIRRQLAETLQFYPTQLVRVEVADFLKTTAGKIQRRKMVEHWLSDKALNDNPIAMTRLLSAPLFDTSLTSVAPVSLGDFLAGGAASERAVVALSAHDVDALLHHTNDIQQRLAQHTVLQLVLITEIAKGPELERWAQAFEACVTGVSIQVVTCDDPSKANRVPMGNRAKRLHFDGMTGFEEREFAMQWQRGSTPVALKTASYSVVTGASGGIAHHLLEMLIEAGEFVVLFSRSKPKFTECLTSEQYCWIPVDFSAQDTLRAVWNEARIGRPFLNQAPRRVFHLAAQFHRDSLESLTPSTLCAVKTINEGGLKQLVGVLSDNHDVGATEWFVFGSLNGVRGGHQSLSYNMSQAATRSVVTQLRQQGRRACWFGWSAWEGTGMSVGEVDIAALKRAGLQALQTEDCLQAMPSLLSLPAGDYLIGAEPICPVLPVNDQSTPARDEALQSVDVGPLRAIWQQLLGCDVIPDQQSFFELGGSSILLYKLHHHIEHDLGYNNVTMADLFSAPTLQSMSMMLTRFRSTEASSEQSQNEQSIKTPRHASVKQRFKRRMNK